jgi:hypothetical protein
MRCAKLPSFQKSTPCTSSRINLVCRSKYGLLIELFSVSVIVLIEYQRSGRQAISTKQISKCHTSAVHNVRWAVLHSRQLRLITELCYKSNPPPPAKQRLTKFNEPIPPDEPPPLETEIGLENEVKQHVTVLHLITDQAANPSKTLSKIETR